MIRSYHNIDEDKVLSSLTSLLGRKGRTRNVAARNPDPIRAWNAIVKGLEKYFFLEKDHLS